MAEQSELKARSEVSRQNILEFHFLTRSFASRSKLRYAQPCLANLKSTTNWSFYAQGLDSWIPYMFLETFDARKANGCNAAKSDAYHCVLRQHLSRRPDVPAEASMTCKKIQIFIDLKIQFTPSPSKILHII